MLGHNPRLTGGGSMVPVPFYKTCLYKLAVLVGRSVLENLKYEIYWVELSDNWYYGSAPFLAPALDKSAVLQKNWKKFRYLIWPKKFTLLNVAYAY